MEVNVKWSQTIMNTEADETIQVCFVREKKIDLQCFVDQKFARNSPCFAFAFSALQFTKSECVLSITFSCS